MLTAIEAFGADAARLHLDLTTLTVSGAYPGSALVGKGWSSSRTVQRQVRVWRHQQHGACRCMCARTRAARPS